MLFILGYPLYGPYGYATGSRTVKLMKTGYAKRTDMNGKLLKYKQLLYIYI
jgi:hypothetical protein